MAKSTAPRTSRCGASSRPQAAHVPATASVATTSGRWRGRSSRAERDRRQVEPARGPAARRPAGCRGGTRRRPARSRPSARAPSPPRPPPRPGRRTPRVSPRSRTIRSAHVAIADGPLLRLRGAAVQPQAGRDPGDGRSRDQGRRARSCCGLPRGHAMRAPPARRRSARGGPRRGRARACRRRSPPRSAARPPRARCRGHQVEEQLAVDLPDRRGVRAAHVVGVDLEARDGVRVGLRREQQVAVLLEASVRWAPGATRMTPRQTARDSSAARP